MILSESTDHQIKLTHSKDRQRFIYTKASTHEYWLLLADETVDEASVLFSLYADMQYYSTNDPSFRVTFREALLSGMAPDGGLYMPEYIPQLTDAQLQSLSRATFADAAFLLAQEFVGGEIPDNVLRRICTEAYDFEVPLVDLDSSLKVLELFHGPTLAFKDFAARFMARCVDYFLGQQAEQKTILVATSGDTGGAIGHGFLGMENVSVNILYPKGGVSPIQEAQLTTIGGNVRTFEVEGTFDDCQRMVKEAFLDEKLASQLNLMSANSINVGRILPQSFYYTWASLRLRLKEEEYLVYSVPSGNMGNVTGAYFAQKMGAPIDHLIVSNNANHPFVDYLQTGNFTPVNSVRTLSNAMDIGRPNNFFRIEHLFSGNVDQIREYFSGYFFDDAQTLDAMREVFETHGYLMCPHTAVGYLGAKEYLASCDEPSEIKLIIAATAHPAKFVEVVEKAGLSVEIPESLARALEKSKEVVSIQPTLPALLEGLISC